MDGERDPGFGQQFAEHMAIGRYHCGRWSGVEIVPFTELSLSPAAMVFHYGQAIFEGLKAFRQPDGTVSLFRPDDHARRFNRSARRLAMPELPPATFVAAAAALVDVDHAWVPSGPGQSLYLRPMMIATEVGLGVRAANQYLFTVFASPVGSYFAGGPGALSVWAAMDDVRAAPGGTGAAKCAGNYGASLAAKAETAAAGCQETLWLDAAEHGWIEELSGMNVVFVAGEPTGPALVTPPVSDTILDGVTRRSLLRLARHLGLGVTERRVALAEAHTFVEAFACGTAAAVVPIGRIRTPSCDWTIGDGAPGPVTVALRDALLAIQEGRSDDVFGWRTPVATGAPLAQVGGGEQ